MSISIGGLNGKRLGEVRDISVQGFQGCGVYGLYLILKVNAGNLNSEAFLSQLQCRIELGDNGRKIANGFIEGNPVIRWTEFSEVEQLGFFFYLSSSQIEAIEESRKSGDLKLGVWLSGEAVYEEMSQNFSDRRDYLIQKQQWLDVLSKNGYQETLLFELPMPKETDGVGENLRELLERAQKHILNGHYQESVGLCRQAIEVVENSRKDKNKASEAVRKYTDNRRREMSVEERMLFLREVLKNVTQLGAHHGDEFSRYQAQSVLGMTVSLLSSPEIGLIK